MATELSPLMVVLIIGLAILALVVLVGLIMAIQKGSAFNEAESALEAAILQTGNALDTFASTVGASLTRLVLKIRDIFERFFGAITSAAASLLKYLTDGLTQLISGVSSLATGLFTALDTLLFQFQSAVQELISQVINTITTVPIQVAMQIILAFVKLVTDGIHLIFCFVASGFSQLSADILAAVDAVQTTVDGIATDFTQFFVDLPNILFTEVVGPLTTVFNMIIATLDANVLQPILIAVNAIEGVVDDICSFLGC